MRTGARWLAGLLLGSALLGAAASPARADAGAVRLGDQVVLRLVGDNKLSAARRAAIVQHNLDAALKRRLPPQKLALVALRGVVVIAWAGHRLCTVDGLQARHNHTTVRHLAAAWMKNLRDALSEGYLSVSPAHIVMPVGESRRITLGGLAGGPCQASGDGHTVEVSASSDGDTVTVKALSAGSCRVELTREGSRVVVPVTVREWAGLVPDRVYFAVSGQPASRDLLQAAALQAARGAVQVRPGAAVALKSAIVVPPSLGLGGEAVLHLPLAVEGAAYYPIEKTMDVVIRNESVDLANPTLLMVSNRPEKVEEEGVLFRSRFTREHSTRLLYSHVNGSNKNQYMWVILTNRTDRPVRLLVIQGEGGPAREELYVGHRCNTRFLEDLQSRQGLIVTIPPMKAWELGRYEMSPRELVSGLCQMQILDGDELEVAVEASPLPTRAARVDNVIDSPFNPFRIHPKGVFSDPYIVVDEKFVVGAREQVEIPFGRAPWLIDRSSGEPNTGNYGVMYEVRLEVSNPTQEKRKVSLFFEPINGVALGSFLVEGKLMETNCLKPPARALISTVELAPQQNRTIRIMTMPQAGSHYPARILIQSPVQETHRESGGT